MAYTVDLRQKPVQPEPQGAPVVESRALSPQSISWTTSLSRIPTKKVASLTLMIAIAGGIATMLLDHNYLFATLLFLTGVVMTLSSYRKPELHHIEVGPTSITIHDQRYLYQDVKSFWLNYDPPHQKELSIELKKTFTSYIKVPLEDTNPLAVRALMIGIVPEKMHEDNMLDSVLRKLEL